MSILVDTETRLCTSGITGREGTFHSLRNRDYGTNVVAGVTPGKGGQDVDGIPVFNTFHEAVDEAGANTAMIFVPPRFAADSILEAEDAGIELIIAITEGIPAHDELRVYNTLKKNGRCAADRAQLPRHPVPRQGQRRDHPGLVLQRRQRRGRLALGHAHLPDRQRAGPERIRQLEHRRDRRRPGAGHRLHRRHRDVPGGPGDRADRHVRRDRWRRRGAGRRFHRRPGDQADDRLHRRLHGSAGQDHGPRRGDRVRVLGGAEAKAQALESKGVKVGKTPTEVAQAAIELLGQS